MSDNKIKKGIMYVFIANIINLLISLFSGFVLPKFLSIETYANIKLFQLYITYIGILHLGFSDGMYLRLGGKAIDKLNKKDVLEEFKTFKKFQFIVTVVAVIICIILKQEILLYCALVIFPVNIANYIRSLYNATGLFKKYSRYTNINTILIFLINIALLLIIKSDNYQTYLILYVIAYFVYWIFIEYENRKIFGKDKVKPKTSYLFEDIKFGFFLMIGNFCNVIFTTIDRIFVQNLLGTIKFAFYSFAVSIENLMNVFITPISTVMYNYFCVHDNKEDVVRIKKYILIFSAFIVSLIFGAKLIVDIWLVKYKEALPVLFLLIGAQYISIMIRCIHVNLYKAEKKQNRYFIIMIIMVVFSIISNAIAYLVFKDMIAIAAATLLTNIIWLIIGEIDFKIYRLRFKDYLYIFLSLLLFLLYSFIFNAVIGGIVYIFTIIIISLILQKDSFFKFFNLFKEIIKRKLLKK